MNRFMKNVFPLCRNILQIEISCAKLSLNKQKVLGNIAKIGGFKDMSRPSNNPVPMNQRKYLSMKEAGQYTGIGLDRMKQIKKDGEFTKYITVGKQNKVLIDRVAFEQWLEEKGHI